jgi:histone acetyltransferase (RNA polymerase elongator complex component)
MEQKLREEMIQNQKEFLEYEIKEKILRTANNLRQIADRIEKHAKENKSIFDKIQDTQHDILWGMANLGIDSLVSKLDNYTELIKLK